MNFLDFKHKMFKLACFSTNQIYAWQPDFDRNNLTRWLKKGYIFRLKQGYYTFPEYKANSDYIFYFANKIYNPSYISLHSALSFHGIIPEAVVQITSVTPLKTATFSNEIATFAYQTIHHDLMFGYDLNFIEKERAVKIATPEKAILDLLYLYLFYQTEDDFLELRFDENYVTQKLDMMKLVEFCDMFQNVSLEKRLKKLIHVYGL